MLRCPMRPAGCSTESDCGGRRLTQHGSRSGLRPVPAGRRAAGGEEGQAAMGTQTLIWARAVSAGTRGPPGGKLSRALVVRSRWRLRSMLTRWRARLARALSRFAVIAEAGRLAVAVPARVVVMTAR